MVYIDGAYDSNAWGAIRPRAIRPRAHGREAHGREAINHFETTQ